MFKRFLSWLLGTSAALPAPVEAPAAPAPMRISDIAYAEVCAAYGEPLNPWTVPERPPFVPADVAMDAAPGGSLTELYNWATKGAFSEGLGFLGYPYLAELSQRPEYRRVSEIIAAEATRKWIKINGPDEDRVNAIEAAMKRFDIVSRFREAAEQDGFFGRSQIFVDLGHPLNAKELSKPLPIRKEKIGKGKVVNFKVVEPFWSYPGVYDSINPLAADYYRPKYWYVMSAQVHSDRLLTFVGREMPDMLKPSYMFGGLSLSQMCKPYVDNWLRTRQSVSDLVHSFSTMVLATDMNTILSGGSADTVVKRAEVYNRTRDNRGLLMINKDAEELTNVSTPLGTLDKLQAQSQEQIASVSGIPLVVLLGVTPSGLNASSDGEIKTFYAMIKAYQERVMRGPLQTVLEIIQLDLDGEIDEEITFEFLDLWELDETAKAAIRKSDADVDVAYVTNGIVSPEEVRERVANDEGSPYFGVDLSSAPPEPPEDDGDDDGDKPAQDAWSENDHPRAANGQFGSGGGGASPAAARKDAEAPQGPMVTASGKPIPSHVVDYIGRDGVERIKALIANKGSKARDILDALAPLDAISKGHEPTLAHGQEPTPEFWAGRKYRDSDGSEMGIAGARVALVAKAESYAGAGGVKRDKQARILLGPPAAGKSTSAERIAETQGYAIVDGDDAKKVIPEFAGGVGASAVHEESSEMAAEVLDTMLARGDNVILPLVGGSPGSIRKRIERLKLAGYSVTVDVVDVNEDEAARRMAGRALSSGRHISSSYFMSIGDGPVRTYETLKAEYPDLGFGRIDGNGAAKQETYKEAVNHPAATTGTRLFN